MAELAELAGLADAAGSAAGPADRAAAMVAAQRIAARVLRDAVTQARESGMSWRELSAAMDVPATTLHRKYNEGGGLFPPGLPPQRSTAPKPDTATGAAHTGDVPLLPMNLFVGRDRELADLPVALRQHRLVTVTGPAGVGKTRLALEVTHQVTGVFRGGVFWAGLAGLPVYAGAAQVTAAITAAVQSPEEHQPAGQVLGDACANGAVLLVLDNCEHLIAGCGMALVRLLADHPLLTVLATSRQLLDVTGEARVRLDPLPAADPSMPWLAASPAVRLFTDRARLAIGDAALEGQERIIAEVCNAVDGLPLAIELAARQCAVLPVKELPAQLSHQLDLAAARPDSVLGPHTGLHASIGWSYQLCDPVEQSMFRRLSLLPDGVSDLTASALSDGLGLGRAEVWAVLTSLAGRSLLTTSEEAPRRFGMLAAMREYGQEQLASTRETSAITEVLLAWLAQRAETILRDRYRGQDTHTFRWAAGELAAFRFATETARATRDPRYPRLATVTALLLAVKAEIEEAKGQLAPVLSMTGLRPADTVWARAVMAKVLLVSGDHAAAQRHAEIAREVAAGAASATLEFQAIGALIHAYGNGDAARSADLGRQQAALLRDNGDAGPLPLTLNNLAWDLVVLGEYAEAGAVMEEMLGLGSGTVADQDWHTAGTVALMLGDADQAFTRFERGLELSFDTGMTLDLIEGIALVSARSGMPGRTLRILAALAAQRAQLGIPTDDWSAVQISAARTAALSELAASAAAAAEADGAGLTLEQLIEEALHGQLASPGQDGPLTEREITVAQLVARGYTTKQIAARLGVAARTVTTHIARARDKLGLARRTELAAWAAIHLPNQAAKDSAEIRGLGTGSNTL